MAISFLCAILVIHVTIIIIAMIKLLDADWLRRVQLFH